MKRKESKTVQKVKKMETQGNIKGLIKTLRHRDWETVGTAAAALGRIGDASVVEPLVRVLDRHPSPGIRQSAASALGNIGDARALDALIIHLLDQNEWGGVHDAAARALGQIGDPRAIGPLSQVLMSDKPSGQQCAAEALAVLGSPAAIKALNQALDHKAWQVQYYTVIALSKIDDEAVIEPLTRALQTTAREPAAKALQRRVFSGQAGPDVRKILVKYLVTSLIQSRRNKEFLYSRGKADLAQALEWLGWQPETETEKAHFLIGKGDWEALVELGKAAIRPLLLSAADPDPEIRVWIVRCLGRIADSSDMPALNAALRKMKQDPDARVRQEAKWSKVRIKGKLLPEGQSDPV